MTLSVIIVFAIAITIAQAVCPEGCDEPVAIYKDLQCNPIYAKPTDCCPIKYDCSVLEKRDSQKCTYRGKTYAIGDQIPKEETYPNCRIGCFCQAPETITCAALDCPEWLGNRPRAGNHFTYTLGDCCSTGEMGAPYATCKVGDEEYKEGQKFTGPKPCTQCVCAKDFAGKFEAPFCMEQTCTAEMNDIGKIRANCAPSYFAKSCCPFTWICPTDENYTDNIVHATPAKSDNHEQCKYGEKLLDIGDSFHRRENISAYDWFEIDCMCKLPPFVTCHQKQVFDQENTPQHIKDALGPKKN